MNKIFTLVIKYFSVATAFVFYSDMFSGGPVMFVVTWYVLWGREGVIYVFVNFFFPFPEKDKEL